MCQAEASCLARGRAAHSRARGHARASGSAGETPVGRSRRASSVGTGGRMPEAPRRRTLWRDLARPPRGSRRALARTPETPRPGARRPRAGWTPSTTSAHANDVSGLLAAFTRPDLEFDSVALVERPKTAALDRRVVDEDLSSLLRGDETVAALITEPFDGATGHVTPSLSVR